MASSIKHIAWQREYWRWASNALTSAVIGRGAVEEAGFKRFGLIKV